MRRSQRSFAWININCFKKNGIDQNKKVINVAAPYPFLTCSNNEIEYFRHHINIINKIGLKDIYKIKDIVFDIDNFNK